MITIGHNWRELARIDYNIFEYRYVNRRNYIVEVQNARSVRKMPISNSYAFRRSRCPNLRRVPVLFAYCALIPNEKWLGEMEPVIFPELALMFTLTLTKGGVELDPGISKIYT